LLMQAVFADGLPVITVQPANQTVARGSTATLAVTATGATSYQWRFNGADISGATSSTLQVANVQPANTGYYMVVAKNATGWVPSQMAYLFIDYTLSGAFPPYLAGTVPFSNKATTNWNGQVRDYYNQPLNNYLAQVAAGPQLDQMQSIGSSVVVTNGYYGLVGLTRTVPTVASGQFAYYRVDITDGSGAFVTHSRILNLTLNASISSVNGLIFPGWWVGEGLEPAIQATNYPNYPTSPTNQMRVLGETFSLTNTYFAYTDYGTPTAQWRKNGALIPDATNFPAVIGGGSGVGGAGYFQAVLTITNAQAQDAGIYDLMVLGNNWLIGPKTVLSIQITNGYGGVFQSPRFRGTNFVCDLLGAASRSYAIQWSTNLTDWHNFTTQYNSAGTITFSNAPALGGVQFYRARLQP